MNSFSYEMDEIVSVAPRTGPNKNKHGGIGTIYEISQDRTKYSVRYILGGRETDIDRCFLSKHSFVEATRDRDLKSSRPPTTNSPTPPYNSSSVCEQKEKEDEANSGERGEDLAEKSRLRASRRRDKSQKLSSKDQNMELKSTRDIRRPSTKKFKTANAKDDETAFKTSIPRQPQKKMEKPLSNRDKKMKMLQPSARTIMTVAEATRLLEAQLEREAKEKTSVVSTTIANKKDSISEPPPEPKPRLMIDMQNVEEAWALLEQTTSLLRVRKTKQTNNNTTVTQLAQTSDAAEPIAQAVQHPVHETSTETPSESIPKSPTRSPMRVKQSQEASTASQEAMSKSSPMIKSPLKHNNLVAKENEVNIQSAKKSVKTNIIPTTPTISDDELMVFNRKLNLLFDAGGQEKIELSEAMKILQDQEKCKSTLNALHEQNRIYIQESSNCIWKV
jgi:hypothetical protein